MPVRLGTVTPAAIKQGSIAISAVYAGSSLVWPEAAENEAIGTSQATATVRVLGTAAGSASAAARLRVVGTAAGTSSAIEGEGVFGDWSDDFSDDFGGNFTVPGDWSDDFSDDF